MKRAERKARGKKKASRRPAPSRGRVRSGEDELVRKITAIGAARERGGASGGGLRLGIGDDAALWRPRPGYETVLTCDWFLEGTHFLRAKHPPDSVGWKCLARAVSDVAAMGGEPRCFLLSLALPASQTGAWLDGFLGGLRRAQRRLGCALAGGDVTRSERILISVAVVGEVARGAAVRRSGAKPGDIVFVSGRLGEAELGLRRLPAAKRVSERDALLRKHLYPEPRLGLGAWLAKRRLATAMMDLSDGLSSDVARLCAASGVGARIEAAKVPVPRAVGLGEAEALRAALHGGDYYELLFTVASRHRGRIPRRFGGVPLTPIGVITREGDVLLVTADRSIQVARSETRGDARRVSLGVSTRRGRGERSNDVGARVEPLTPAGWDPFRSR